MGLRIGFACAAVGGLLTGIGWWAFTKHRHLEALTVGIGALDQTEGAVDIFGLLEEAQVPIVSSARGPVREPTVPPQAASHMHPSLGVGQSQFVALIPGGWGVVRYLGPNPAGAGLKDEDLSRAQRERLGAANDSIPVVVVAHTLGQAMEHYFKPLILRLPGGTRTLNQIYINATYFSPEYPSTAEFDNAFVKGIQSLFVYPNGCFQNPASSACFQPPWLSPGHDPTVVVHELGHIIFNHMRGGRSLEGFQWSAVNEGYADYLSASFFNVGAVGTVWKSSPSSLRHLRSLEATLTTNDGNTLPITHNYGVIWGATLWRIRQRLAAALAGPQGPQGPTAKSPLAPWEAAVIQSIVYLGETSKPRLGDAATALLKALDALALGEWKGVAREEFARAGIDLSPSINPQVATRSTDVRPRSDTPAGGCGVVGGLGGGAWAHWLFLLLVPALASGCKVARRSLEKGSGAPTLWYRCYPKAGAFGAEQKGYKPGSTTIEEALPLANLYLQELPGGEGPNGNMARIQVSDERFAFSPSTLFAIVDISGKRVDHFRGKDGEPLERGLDQTAVDLETAQAHLFALYTTLLVSGGGALQGMTTQDPVQWEYEGVKYTASFPLLKLSPGGPVELPRTLSTDRGVLCQAAPLGEGRTPQN